MRSALGVWQKSQDELKGAMTPISYNTWIVPLAAICLAGDMLVLQAQSDVAKNTLKNIYTPLITDCVNRANEMSLTLRIIDDSELDEYISYMEPRTVYSSDFVLDPKYTFDSFVVGKGNNLAYAAAQAVADNPGNAYNPLFIYGGVGLGKTHLMHAIGHRIQENNPQARIIYITMETFTNELIQAISEKTNVQFRNKYRTADVLMIDDIQFLTTLVRTQEEFFNTFNALHTSKKQIILTSDKPPKELINLEDRLVSRFEGGLIADIQPPDIETRIAILKRRASIDGVDISEQALAYIAERVFSNIRQLEGAFNRVVAFCKLTQIPIDPAGVDAALKDIIPDYDTSRITLEYIQQVISDYYDVPLDGLISQRRSTDVTYPRQIGMYLSKTLTSESMKSIGDVYGGRHYSTVISACDKISEDIKSDKKLSGEIDDLTKRIKAVKRTS